MKRPDPRVMLLIAACLSIMGILIGETWLLACVLGFSVLFSVALGAKITVLIKRLRGLLYIAAFVALMESIFNAQGQALIQIGRVGLLTTGGLLRGVNTMLRFTVVLASASVVTLARSREIIQGLIQLKVPYELAFMASVALRFLPVFAEEFRNVVMAIQLRGVNLRRIPVARKLKLYGHIFMPVTYAAVDRAQKLSYSMELRAFRVFHTRTSLLTLRLSGIDYVYIVVMPLLTTAVLWYYYLFL